MLVRTISQLPEVEAKTDFMDGKMEISIPESAQSNKYTSKSIKYETIEKQIENQLSIDIAKTYHLTADNAQPINVNDEMKKLKDVLNADMTINGAKKLGDWPWVQKDFPTDFRKYGNNSGDFILPNVKKVKQLITETPSYFSTPDSAVAEGNPLPYHKNPSTEASKPESLGYDATVGSDKFYFWRIDDQGTDSGRAIYDIQSATEDHYEKMRDTGNLVVWGWLADNGEVEPEMAWVGLFGKLKCKGFGDDYTQDWLPLCIRPWIRGANASILQYVGFNIPVRAGLELKIKTGFPVNGSNSAFQNPGSMTFQDRNVPNAFFGYVVTLDTQ